MATAEIAKSPEDNSSESRPLLGWLPESAAWEALIGRAAERNIFYVPAFALAAARYLLARKRQQYHRRSGVTATSPACFRGP